MTKHCSSGKCNSDERYHPNKKFAKFVQPKGHHPDLKRCQRWVHLMGRLDLSVEHINRTKYVCEDHFNEGVDLDYRTNKDLEPYPPGYDRNKRKRLRRAENDNQDQTRCKIFWVFSHLVPSKREKHNSFAHIVLLR